MINKNVDMFKLMSEYISKSDVYAATVMAKVSAFIYECRKQKKMTQAEFADFMDVTQGMVSKWESAEYNFTIENIAQISEKLDVTFDIEFTPESDYVTKGNENNYVFFEGTNNKFDGKALGFIVSAA